MSFWNSMFDWFWSGDDGADTAASSIGEDDAYCIINPATGLPMVGGCGNVDVAGNPYGTDLSHHDTGFSGNADWSSISDASAWDSSSWDSGSSIWND